MTDAEIIKWAREFGTVAAMMGDSDGARLCRLADLAERGSAAGDDAKVEHAASLGCPVDERVKP
jgi:hypothetical protein